MSETTTDFDGVIEEIAEEEEHSYSKIHDDVYADWAVRAIKADQAECDRLTGTVDAEIEALQNKKAAIMRKYENRIENLKFHLNAYFGTVEHRKLKASEQYTLPSGKLSMAYGKTKHRFTDANGNDDKKGKTLSEWLELHGYDEFVKVTVEPDWAELKKHITAQGDSWIMTDTKERIEGIQAFVTDNEFEVK